jgi:hypothetical protein
MGQLIFFGSSTFLKRQILVSLDIISFVGIIGSGSAVLGKKV